MVSQLSGKMWGLNYFWQSEGDWEQVVLCFRSIDEKIAGENEKGVC